MLKTLFTVAGVIGVTNAALTVGRCKKSPHIDGDKCCCVRSWNRKYRGSEVQLCIDGPEQLPTLKWANCPVKEDGKIIKGEFEGEFVEIPRRVYERFFVGWKPKRKMTDSCKVAFRTFQKNAVGRTWGTASRKVVDKVCEMMDTYEPEEKPIPQTHSTGEAAEKFDQFNEFDD